MKKKRNNTWLSTGREHDVAWLNAQTMLLIWQTWNEILKKA